jgi:four helix bundle protein
VKDGKESKDVKDRPVKSGPVRHYGDLLVYQQAYRLALEVSKLTKSFPKQEQFEIGKQLRASSRSVVANIIKGWAKRVSAAEFKRHLVIAKGESAETEYWLNLSKDEGLAPIERCLALHSEYGRLGMMIYNLWKEWKKF